MVAWPAARPMSPFARRAPRSPIAFLSVVALAGALVFSASYANLSLGARDVGGLVMPPGMIMTRDTPGQAMRDMAAVDPTAVSYRAPVDARGDQPLEPRIENGVKVFDLEASVIEWNILPYERVMAYAFNHQVPGPRISLTEGDHVRFNVTNHLPEPTTIHWHGLIVPNAMDGPAEITQDPIPPGGHFTYEFTVQQAGTFFYHSHTDVDRQQALGLYGALIIAPKDAAARHHRRPGARRPAPGVERARGLHLPGDADGRRDAELLHDQRQGLPLDRDRPPQGRPASARPVHRLAERVHPPDAHPRRAVHRRRHRRRHAARERPLREGHGQRRPRASATTSSGRLASPASGCSIATSTTTRRTTTSRSRAAAD